jgi:hypothetical protein
MYKKASSLVAVLSFNFDSEEDNIGMFQEIRKVL